MIALILAAALSGNPHCVPQRIVHRQNVGYVAVKQKAVVYPLYVASDSSDAAARLKATEEAILRLTEVVEQQQLLIQAGGSEALLQQTSRYELQARQILNRSCVECHKPGKTDGGIDLTGEIGIGLMLLVAETVAAGEMPPEPNPALPEDDVQTLVNWSREDREAVRAYLRGDREGDLK